MALSREGELPGAGAVIFPIIETRVVDHGRALLYAALVVGLTACGGSGVDNVETARSSLYTKQPHTILAVQENGDPFPDTFKAVLSRKMTACGVTLRFAPWVNGAPILNWPEAEAQLIFHQYDKKVSILRNDRTTEILNQWTEAYRYKFSLYDVPSRQTVWNGRGEFHTHDDQQDEHMVSLVRERAAESWSDDLIELMRKDRLLPGCGSAPPTPTPPPVVALADQPAQANTAGTRFKIDDVYYYTLPEAEEALRRRAAAELANVKPLGVTSRTSLVIVMDTDAKFAAEAKFAPDKTDAQKESSLAFRAAVRKVSFDSEVEAIRKSGLFRKVTLVRDDNVATEDFKGADYKICRGWSSSWLLVRKGGGRELVKGPLPGDLKYADLAVLLTDLQTALAALDKSLPSPQ